MTAAKTNNEIATTPPPLNIMEIIAAAVRDPEIDTRKMRELLELHRELERDIDRRLFFSAMSRVQAEISQVATDAANPQTASRYASYAALDKALRPHYTNEGFSVSFDSTPVEGGVMVTCIISRGAWETRHHATVPTSTTGIKGAQMMTTTHAAASGISYGKRYSLAMGFNVAVERDDDGNRAGTKTLSASMVDELMDIAKGDDTTEFCAHASEHLGYKIENLSMVLRSDMRRVKSWLTSWHARKKEGTA